MRIELGVVALAAKGHSSLGWWRVVAQRGRSAMIDTIKDWLSIGRRVWKTGHQPGLTPFEINLKNELEVEQLRFANEWLFSWHNINIPYRVVNVDDFQGRRISVGGVRFEGQLQLIYWQAIRRYFALKSHDAFRAWDVATKDYPPGARRSSLDGTGTLLRQFVAAITERATETDRRLRGRGSPGSVQAYNPTSEQSLAIAQILRLVESHKALTAVMSPIQRLEAFGRSYPGIGLILTLVLAAIGLWLL